jgi:myosin heavy subunit
MVIQALLISLLFFSEGYVKYVTIAIILLLDLMLFIGLLTSKWSFKEIMIFAAIFCSGMFILFYIFTKSLVTIIFGIVLMVLFLVIALLELISQPIPHKTVDTFEKIQKPEEPAYYYDIEYDSLPKTNSFESMPKETMLKDNKNYNQNVSTIKTKSPEPVMHVKMERSDVKNKLAAKAVVNELEREASQLKNAEKIIKDLEIYGAEKELLKEGKALEDVQRQLNVMQAMIAKQNARKEIKETTKKIINEDKKVKEHNTKNLQAKKELKKEATELLKVQKQINEINRLKQINELKRESKELQNAQKKVNELQFLSKQNQLAKQTESLVKAQKQINEITKINQSNAKLKQVNELKREAKELQNAQKKANELQFLNKQEQLAKQTASLVKAQKQINEITKINQSNAKLKQVNELKREAKELQNAQKKANELQFLNKQEQLVKQAKSIAKAQKEIDEMNKNTKKSLVKQQQVSKFIPSVNKPKVTKSVKIKTIKVPLESFYFATDTGNKFHEPGCIAIKNVPKNKLILYTNKKDAMKKGLQACNVCIPK